MEKSPITTHILDLHKGRPGQGVEVELYAPNNSLAIATAKTDDDGRILLWPNEFDLSAGEWRLVFKVKPWFEQQQRKSFFADIELKFNVEALNEHYHVPLLLNEFGYSTYRGS